MTTHGAAVGEDNVGKAGGAALQCIVVTPERTWLDEVVDSVVLPAYDGEIGILHGHTPLIARLGHGELRTRTGGSVQRYFVDGGFAQVRDDVVTILTNRAVPASSVDPAAAATELQDAQARKANSEYDQAEKTKAVDRARALVRVAAHGG